MFSFYKQTCDRDKNSSLERNIDKTRRTGSISMEFSRFFKSFHTRPDPSFRFHLFHFPLLCSQRTRFTGVLSEIFATFDSFLCGINLVKKQF